MWPGPGRCGPDSELCTILATHRRDFLGKIAVGLAEAIVLGLAGRQLGLQLHQQDQPHRQVDKVIISKDYSLFNKYLFSVKIDLSRSSLTSKC